MAKRVFPLLNKEGNSWCQILNCQKTKRHPWMERRGKDISWNGKVIVENLKCLRKGIKKCVGNGKETAIWTDPWIVIVPLKCWPTYINVIELEKLEMDSDLIEGFRWESEILNSCFGKKLIHKIEGINVDEESGNT
ncbi:hypothetical protein Cni_G14133 [Canna indica]|uniref:Uncharacterized protein n=1 Tax=Canna indica TaxID=4628 RepID=A0AAQ3KDI7_9LILI|nr:hypothetical protein Cni_G14133 [Canna indica]